METVMDVLNRLSMNPKVMSKIIEHFYRSVVLYDGICKDRGETAEDLLLMKISTVIGENTFIKTQRLKRVDFHQTSTWGSCVFSTWRRQEL